MKQRRVATGQSADGKSVIVADESIEPVMVALAPGLECFPIWGSDRAVNLPHDGSKPLTSGWFPPQSGFRFTILTIPPDDQAAPPADIKAALAEASEKLPGMLEAVDVAFPHMHATDTVDFVVVLSGRLCLEVDDGKEVELSPGDSVIQNGTRHAWHNRSSVPCQIVSATIGARRT
ncbi:MAG TPA: cupin domain-containing protein [Steroidobacteraceae bacterium]|nr:cupin domain-containing protein [Steroidobacteraceae bacterium]